MPRLEHQAANESRPSTRDQAPGEAAIGVSQRPGSTAGARSSAAAWRLETAIWVLAVLFTLLGLLVALALLWQRGAADPWARVNVYTGGVLLVGGLAGIAQAVTFLRSALRSLGVAGEALGLTYDPGIVLFAIVIEPAKLAVLLDYSRWHLVPALEQPGLQALGLVFAVIGSAGLIWTDTWLARHFASDAAAAELMTRGPYRVVRHPRYLSILLLVLSFPLAFASIVGWALWFIVLAAVLHRIAREEVHLRAIFGAAYEAYARRTVRLVPLLF